MKQELLSEREKAILGFIREFAQLNAGNYPKKSDIQNHFDYKSNNSVTQIFDQLHEKGVLSWVDKSKRFYSINLDEYARHFSPIRKIFLEGMVSAGVLKEAVSNREAIEISTKLVNNNKEYFALKVFGDSMIGDNIINGDTVILERVDEVPFGSIVVVQVSGEATLKRILKKGKKIELRASNPEYQPIIIDDEPSFKILGKLHMVIREMSSM